MNRRGVTLVELVATIALVLILASVAIGGLVGVQTWRAATAIRRIHADISQARTVAMLTGRRTLCRLDLGKQRYELTQEPAPGTGTINGEVMTQPLDGAPWRVQLGSLGGGVSIANVNGVSGSAFGFGKEGVPLAPDGDRLTRDIAVRFATGEQIVVRAGSGLAEIIWP